MYNLWLNILVILSPSLWIRQGVYNKYWDKIVKESISEGTAKVGHNYITIGPYNFYTGNGAWLGSSHCNSLHEIEDNYNCSRKTAILLRDKIKLVQKSKVEEVPKFYKKFKETNSKLHKAIK